MAFNNLRSLVKNNLNNTTPPIKEESKIIQKDDQKDILSKKISYEDWGFEKAKNLNGSSTGLLNCLARIRQDHEAIVRNDKEKQDKLKQPFIEAHEKKEEELKQKNLKRDTILNQSIVSLELKIEELKRGIISIKENPEQLLPDKLSKVSFYIGLFILCVITIYLFVFYSSASYSAFFKEFSIDSLGVASSIFDPQAISNAFEDGFTELVLILSMPFVFIGLGFLIHKFQEQKSNKKYFKIGILILLTFLFDAILAYEITAKIYDIKAENSFQDRPDYSISYAIQSINFWLIIFAGFIVYLIWGFVFDFTMETYDKLNLIKQAIKGKEEEIELIKEKIEKEKECSEKLLEEINKLNIELKELKTRIEGVIISTNEFDKILHEFLDGWLHWMNSNKKSKSDIELIHQKAQEFIKNNSRFIETHTI